MKRNFADDKPVTIYTLTNPVTGLIFYVGQTTIPLRKRLSCHWTSKVKLNAKYDTVLRVLRKLNRIPIIESLDTCEYKDKRDIECFWVQTISGWGFDLVNTKHNKNKGYIHPREKKRQRDLRLKVLSESEVLLIRELFRFGDYLKISMDMDCTSERIRQIISKIINGTKKKLPVWTYDKIINYYYNRAKLVSSIYLLQKQTNGTVINGR